MAQAVAPLLRGLSVMPLQLQVLLASYTVAQDVAQTQHSYMLVMAFWLGYDACWMHVQHSVGCLKRQMLNQSQLSTPGHSARARVWCRFYMWHVMWAYLSLLLGGMLRLAWLARQQLGDMRYGCWQSPQAQCC